MTGGRPGDRSGGRPAHIAARALPCATTSSTRSKCCDHWLNPLLRSGGGGSNGATRSHAAFQAAWSHSCFPYRLLHSVGTRAWELTGACCVPMVSDGGSTPAYGHGRCHAVSPPGRRTSVILKEVGLTWALFGSGDRPCRRAVTGGSTGGRGIQGDSARGDRIHAGFAISTCRRRGHYLFVCTLCGLAGRARPSPRLGTDRSSSATRRRVYQRPRHKPF